MTAFNRVAASCVALLVLLLASGCGGGGGGGGTTYATEGKLKLTLASASAQPAEAVTATVTNTDGEAVLPSNAVLMVDLGQDIVVPVPFEVVSGYTIRFIAPLSALTSTSFAAGPGAVELYLDPSPAGEDFTSSDPVTFNVLAQTLPDLPAGDLSLAYLAASILMLQEAIDNFEFLKANTALNDVNIDSLIADSNEQIAAIDSMMDKIKLVQAGSTLNIGKIGDVDITLAPASLPSLDQYMFALFRIAPQLTAAAASARTDAKKRLYVRQQAFSESDFDLDQLYRDLAQGARDIAKRHGDVALAVAGVATAGFLIAGAPALATAAAGLGAVAWFTTTAAGAGIGLSLEAGSSAIMNGQASTQDLLNTGRFVLERYVDLGIGYVQNAALGQFMGEVWVETILAADAVRDVATPLVQEAAQAYQNGTLPSGGIEPVVCGDNVCEGDENVTTCGVDCAVCGNGICEGGENSSSCPGDCPSNVNQCCVSTNNCPGETPTECGPTCCCCGTGQVCQVNHVCG